MAKKAAKTRKTASKAKGVKRAKSAKSAKRAEKAQTKVKREQAQRVMARKPAVEVKVNKDDLVSQRGLDSIPADQRDKYIEVMYAPGEKDADQIVIDGIPFRAYEPTAVPVARENTITTLSQNKLFVADGKFTDEQKVQKKLHDTRRSFEAEQATRQREFDDKMKFIRAGVAADADTLPGKTQPNPPRTS